MSLSKCNTDLMPVDPGCCDQHKKETVYDVLRKMSAYIGRSMLSTLPNERKIYRYRVIGVRMHDYGAATWEPVYIVQRTSKNSSTYTEFVTSNLEAYEDV